MSQLSRSLWTGLGVSYVSQFLRSYMAKETCPYCFDKFSLRETKFRCMTGPRQGRSGCDWTPDEVLKDKWQITEPKGKVVSGPGWFVRSATCPSCSKSTNRRICPHCHLDLPLDFGQNKDITIAIIGSKAAGKTHYIAVLVDVLKRISGDQFDMAVFELDDLTITRYRNEFYNPLFREKRELDATRPSRTDFDVRRPLVFRMQNKKKKSVTLSFFDTAGENLDSEETAAIYNKYIYHSGGVILLIDPLQLEGVNAAVPPKGRQRESNTNPAVILTRVATLINRGLNCGSKPITIPLAITLTKIDEVLPQIDGASAIHQIANHRRGFDLQDFQQLTMDVKSQLQLWNLQPLANEAENRFETVGYFAVSALGESPDRDGRLTAVRPRRAADPLIWLLYLNGFLKERQS